MSVIIKVAFLDDGGDLTYQEQYIEDQEKLHKGESHSAIGVALILQGPKALPRSTDTVRRIYWNP